MGDSAPADSIEVRTVRRSLAAINADDFDGVMACFTEDCVFDGSRIAEGMFEGKARYRRFLEESKQANAFSFSDYTLLEAEDAVVAVVTVRATGSRSGAETLGRMGFLYRMRDGLIARQEIHPDTEALLRSIGLEA